MTFSCQICGKSPAAKEYPEGSSLVFMCSRCRERRYIERYTVEDWLVIDIDHDENTETFLIDGREPEELWEWRSIAIALLQNHAQDYDLVLKPEGQRPVESNRDSAVPER